VTRWKTWLIKSGEAANVCKSSNRKYPSFSTLWNTKTVKSKAGAGNRW